MAKIIGLTGGIGSGKSSVTEILDNLDIPIIDTDIIARQVVEPGSKGLQEVTKAFGKQILQADGSLNRSQLRKIVFQDTVQKNQLESILHPLIQEETLKQIHSYSAETPIIVVAIPLLIEAILKNGKPSYLDQIWVVDCSEQEQLKRATKRDNNSEEQIQNIMNMQVTRQQRLAYADRVIENTGSLDDLHEQVLALVKQENLGV